MDRPSCVACPPGFPQIECIAFFWEGNYRLTYYGWPEDLIAAGIMPAAMREPNGRRYKDANGHTIRRDRYWKVRGERPERFFKIYRIVPPDALDHLPGAKEAVTARAAREAWDAARDRERSQASRKPALFLVVDNTRPNGGSFRVQ